MKVAFWALGLLILSLFGMVVVNLFGNITVTDQLNYTSMKNAVEAAMYDSLDIAHYRTGFCLCTNRSQTAGKWVFDSDDEYKLLDIQFDADGKESCPNSGMKTCVVLHNEYRIKPTTFSESLVRRFAEMVNNNKDYVVTIQDIIEYPPKVSVKIVSKDEEFSPTETNSTGYVISNQIDAIIETHKDASPTPVPSADSVPLEEQTEGYACYYIDGDPYDHRWLKKGTEPAGYVIEANITTSSDCKNVCYCKDDGTACGQYANGKTWSGWTEYTNAKYSKATNSCGACYYKDSEPWQYVWKNPGEKIPLRYVKQESVKYPDCVNVCYCRDSADKNGKKGYECGLYAKGKSGEWPGWTEYTTAEYNSLTKSCGMCYYDKTNDQYVWVDPGGTAPANSEAKKSYGPDSCYNVCYCKDDQSKCGMYARGQRWEGWHEYPDITDENRCLEKQVTGIIPIPTYNPVKTPPIHVITPTPTATTPTGYTSNKDDCYWHAHMFYVGCDDGDGQIQTVRCPLQSKSDFKTQSAAANDSTFYNQCVEQGRSCCSPNTTPVPVIVGEHYYDVYYYGTYTVACSNKHASTAQNAINDCANCTKRQCVARCKG